MMIKTNVFEQLDAIAGLEDHDQMADLSTVATMIEFFDHWLLSVCDDEALSIKVQTMICLALSQIRQAHHTMRLAQYEAGQPDVPVDKTEPPITPAVPAPPPAEAPHMPEVLYLNIYYSEGAGYSFDYFGAAESAHLSAQTGRKETEDGVDFKVLPKFTAVKYINESYLVRTNDREEARAQLLEQQLVGTHRFIESMIREIYNCNVSDFDTVINDISQKAADMLSDNDEAMRKLEDSL